MAIVVEDGTGLADAESYLSVAAFKAWADAWGKPYGAASDTVIEQKLRQASAYIDTLARYKGQRIGALEFPRTGLLDWSGLAVTGLPTRVKTACGELAFTALTEELFVNQDRGGKIVSESVGPISVSYAADAPAGKTIVLAAQMLAPYVRKEGDLMTGPVLATDDTFSFGLGMMDNPEADL